MTQQVNVSAICFSSTGAVCEMARSTAEGVVDAGGDPRLLQVTESAPDDAVATDDVRSTHAASTEHVPAASADDVLWADAGSVGSPTRFDNVSSQLEQFFDSWGGPLSEGQLRDKAYSGFASTSPAHGGQESTFSATDDSVYHGRHRAEVDVGEDRVAGRGGEVDRVSASTRPGQEHAGVDTLVSPGDLLAGGGVTRPSAEHHAGGVPSHRVPDHGDLVGVGAEGDAGYDVPQGREPVENRGDVDHARAPVQRRLGVVSLAQPQSGGVRWAG